MNNQSFNALVLRQVDRATIAAIEVLDLTQLPDRDVLIKVDCSSLNYKDAMALTGTGKIVREFPMVPGIDLAGTVAETRSERYQVGQRVLLTGWGVGERYWGGYSQYQRVDADWLVPLPDGLDAVNAMAVGTAGFTAMLSVMNLERAGVLPASGPVLVSGAAGGVGSVAVAVLSKLGYEVVGLVPVGQAEQAEYVRSLGAADVTFAGTEAGPLKPLENQKWAAAIDVVGGHVLARILSEMQYGGTVAACGLAGGSDLVTTVMPFILRGVRLIGIDSVMCPADFRAQVWQRVVKDLPAHAFSSITRVVQMSEVRDAASELLAGKLKGRVVVSVAGAGTAGVAHG